MILSGRVGQLLVALATTVAACQLYEAQAQQMNYATWDTTRQAIVDPISGTTLQTQYEQPTPAYDAESMEAIMRRLDELERSVAAGPMVPPAPTDEPFDLGCTEPVAPDCCDCSKCAGYDKGFYIRSLDGNYKLKINGMIQARYFATFRDLDPGDGDEGEAGFVLARAPVIFSGNLITPKLTYWMILQSSRNTGGTYMEECRINYEFENGLYMQVGRFRDPTFMRELDVSYTRQMGAERSYQYAIFSTGIQEGICLSKRNDWLNVAAFITDGRGSGNPGTQMDFMNDNTDFAMSTGLDVKLCGDWTQYGDFASWPDEPLAIFIGADMHYETPETGDDVAANNLDHFIAWTIDATVEKCGFMAFGSFVQRSSLVPGENIDQSGVQFLTAYQIVPEKLEPFVRYEYIDFDGFTNVGSAKTAVADSSVNIFSVGTNWYFKRHAAKLTFEVSHAFDPIPVAVSAYGLLLDSSGNDGQTTVRTQLQVLF